MCFSPNFISDLQVEKLIHQLTIKPSIFLLKLLLEVFWKFKIFNPKTKFCGFCSISSKDFSEAVRSVALWALFLFRNKSFQKQCCCFFSVARLKYANFDCKCKKTQLITLLDSRKTSFKRLFWLIHRLLCRKFAVYKKCSLTQTFAILFIVAKAWFENENMYVETWIHF